jgi:hypothetical protein
MATTDNTVRSVSTHEGQVKLASGLNVLAAIWLFISAFAVPMTYGLSWSNAIAAIIVFVLALTRVSGAYQRSALSWWNLVLGVWTIISPWVFRVDPASPAVNNNVITGLIIGALAIWSALATSSDMRTQNPNFSR